jgi:PAS domain S-box-containing protein
MVTQSDERLRQMLEWSPNAMVMVGSTGLIEMVNSETERIFGYSRDELLGKPIEKLLPERYRGNHRGLRTSFFAAPVSRPMGAGRDLHGLRKDTREFPVEIGLKPIETDEGTMVLSVIVDISERKAQEERIHTATRMLAHMNRVATVGEFSASIAHEVNQPLAAMIANANAGLRWLERATPNLDEARAALKRIVDDGQRAGEVIANLRAMFRKDSVEKSTLDLNDLIEDFLGLARRELEGQGILVQTGLTRPLPLVLGNYNQLQQVISNLVRNAADAMELVSGRPRVLG